MQRFPDPLNYNDMSWNGNNMVNNLNNNGTTVDAPQGLVGGNMGPNNTNGNNNFSSMGLTDPRVNTIDYDPVRELSPLEYPPASRVGRGRFRHLYTGNGIFSNTARTKEEPNNSSNNNQLLPTNNNDNGGTVITNNNNNGNGSMGTGSHSGFMGNMNNGNLNGMGSSSSSFMGNNNLSINGMNNTMRNTMYTQNNNNNNNNNNNHFSSHPYNNSNNNGGNHSMINSSYSYSGGQGSNNGNNKNMGFSNMNNNFMNGGGGGGMVTNNSSFPNNNINNFVSPNVQQLPFNVRNNNFSMDIFGNNFGMNNNHHNMNMMNRNMNKGGSTMGHNNMPTGNGNNNGNDRGPPRIMSRWKTKLCSFFMDSNGQFCPHGPGCQFAHGYDELRLPGSHGQPSIPAPPHVIDQYKASISGGVHNEDILLAAAENLDNAQSMGNHNGNNNNNNNDSRFGLRMNNNNSSINSIAPPGLQLNTNFSNSNFVSNGNTNNHSMYNSMNGMMPPGGSNSTSAVTDRYNNPLENYNNSSIHMNNMNNNNNGNIKFNYPTNNGMNNNNNSIGNGSSPGTVTSTITSLDLSLNTNNGSNNANSTSLPVNVNNNLPPTWDTSDILASIGITPNNTGSKNGQSTTDALANNFENLGLQSTTKAVDNGRNDE